MAVKRFDIGELKKPVRMPNGWMKVDAYLTRTGVFTYRNADGTERREYRAPEEVFKQDSIESFEGVPFTNDHPADGLLTAENATKFTKGSVTRVRRDGEKMAGTIMVMDSETVADMEAGKLQISNGYVCDLEEVVGATADGEKYDAIQRNIRGNHVALVAQGRAGASVGVRFDSGDAVMLLSMDDSKGIGRNPEVRAMKKIRLDGVEVEVSDEVASAFNALTAKHAEELKAITAKAEKAEARADATDAEVKKLTAELKEAPEKARQAVEARASLIASAQKVLGSDEKLDALTDRQIRSKVAATVAPDSVKLDSKSDDYVLALFERAVEKADENESIEEGLEGTEKLSDRQDSTDPLAKAAAKFDEAMKNAFKPKK